MNKGEIDLLAERVLGAAIQVHRELGPGLLESAYRIALCHELSLLSLPFETEKPLPVRYKSVALDCSYRLDIVVAGTLLLELKTVEALLPIHEAQILSYLKLGGYRLGFLINFHERLLKHGIKRFIHDLSSPCPP
jgi:GxxExxY protein